MRGYDTRRPERRNTMSGFTDSGGAAYMSNRMDWETPTDLFSRLDNEFHFTLDAASSETNHKCSKYYTAGNSAFDHEWGARRYSAIRHMARQYRNGCASAAWRPAAKAPSSSCFCRLARIPAGSNNSSSTVRRSDSSKADCGSKRTAYRAGRHHSQA